MPPLTIRRALTSFVLIYTLVLGGIGTAFVGGLHAMPLSPTDAAVLCAPDGGVHPALPGETHAAHDADCCVLVAAASVPACRSDRLPVPYPAAQQVRWNAFDDAPATMPAWRAHRSRGPPA
jgi:hypothetical protein